VGALLASLNHTRFDFRFQIPIIAYEYEVRNHDIHHRKPDCNFGQYTMFWDYLAGTYCAYDKTLSINGDEEDLVKQK
jgi:sterol desaturase/sphingolipid hydroxylase (fatty acid hydroxylase superfamily)